MSFTEPISGQCRRTQAEADALHAEIIRRQDIIRRAYGGLPDADRAALYREGVGTQPVAEPQSYPRVKRGGVAVCLPPSISIPLVLHAVRRRKRFRFLW